ncbi:MAG: ribosome biogenesis GTP-binding protein YihA/YsxC [Bacteroidales bacterium]|nr:ribosome biogenesis GTP-binding protein YihA/YsxC [Bacteroidales bacterium]
MKIKKAEFIISNTDVRKCPESDFGEYAFVGRSNVGKSSLINMLLERKKLAKTSQSPGKTLLINHFLINKEWYLVDLPGYGYAKISKSKRKEISNIISDYILNRANLVCLFVLIDARLSPQQIDLEFMEWLGNKQVPFAIIFTKSDKLSKRKLEDNIKSYKTDMLKYWEVMPDYFLSSSSSKFGRDEILDYIDKISN